MRKGIKDKFIEKTIIFSGLLVLLLVLILAGIMMIRKNNEKTYMDEMEEVKIELNKIIDSSNIDTSSEREITVEELNKTSKTKFISGKFIVKNGQIEAYFVSDGKYCSKGPIDNPKIADECYKLDDTKAIINSDKEAVKSTSKSISVTIDKKIAVDEESGIKKYKVSLYKDNKVVETKVIKKIDTVKELVFDNLSSGSYILKIEVINGNDIKAVFEREVITTKMETPSIEVSPKGWSSDKIVTIKAPKDYDIQYSLDGGKTWEKYTEPIKIETNQKLITKVSDGVNYIESSEELISKIDTSAPTDVKFTYTKSTNSITVQASGKDTESGIMYYQFSKDNGSTWTNPQKSNKYTFTNLKTNYYSIKVRVINGTYVNEKEVNEDNSKASASTIVTLPELKTSSCNVVQTGWTQAKEVEVTTPNIFTAVYSLDNGKTWTKYKDKFKVTENKKVLVKTTDGTNYSKETECNVTQIDTTTPTDVNFTYTKTSKSISIEAIAKDTESGISNYQFSIDNGANWTNVQKSNKYTFNNLKTKAYSVKVRAINGTYINLVNSKNSTESKMITINTTDLKAPTYAVVPNGWARTKALTFTYQKDYEMEYSIDNEKTWKKYNDRLTFDENTSVIGRINDGVNYVKTAKIEVNKIDNSRPTEANFSYETTSNSITVVASGTSEGAPISYYQFSKDNGNTWTDVQSENNYTFNNLTKQSYDIKVRVINATYINNGIDDNYLDSESISVTPKSLCIPQFEVTPNNWSTDKAVTISATTDNTNEYSCNGTIKYSLDNGSTWNTYTTPVIITENNTTIIAKLTDGTNETTISSQTVEGIDRIAPDTTAPAAEAKSSKRIDITNNQEDHEIGELGTVQYGISESENGEYYWSNSSVIISIHDNELQPSTTYYIKTKSTDSLGNGPKESEVTTVKTHTIINFDSNGGSNINSIERADGTTLGELPTPTRTGYTFDGWYTEVEDGTKVTSETQTPTSTTTYHAHWTINKYTLTYDFNNFDNLQYWNRYESLDQFSFAYISAYSPVDSSANNITQISMNNSSSINEIIYTRLKTVEGKKYKLEFDYRNSEEYNGQITVQALTKVEDNDNLDNSIKTENLPKEVSDSQQHTSLEFTATGATTYLAFNFGEVTSDSVNIELGNFKLTETVDYNASINNIPEIEQQGFTFEGWYNSRSEGTSIDEMTNMPTHDLTYYARVTINQIEFEDKTINQSYSNTSMFYDIQSPTNGTGDYRYEKISGISNIEVVEYSSIHPNLIVNAGTPAGTHDIVIQATDTHSGSTATATYTINVSKVNATCPLVISSEPITYDGSPHSVSVSNVSGGTIKYRTSTDEEWSTTKPTITNVGTLNTYVMVEGDGNHNSVGCGSGSVIISKATPEVTITPSVIVVSNQGSETVNIKVKSGTSASISGTTTVSIKNTSGNISSLVSDVTNKWNNKAITATSSGYSLNSTIHDSGSPSSTSGTVTITFTPSDTTNYNSASASFDCIVGGLIF